MQRASVFKFFTIELRLTLTFRMGQELVNTLASPLKAGQWRGERRRMGHCQIKQFRWCARLWRVSWQFILRQVSLSSRVNPYSSHLNGRLLLRVSLCLARDLQWVQQFSHSSHLNGRSPLWKDLYSNRIFILREVGQCHGVQFSQWRHSMANIKIYKLQILHFWSSLRYGLCSRL